MSDELRQTGRTTRQIETAPHGAFFYVGHHGRKNYVVALLHKIGRPDIRILVEAPYWEERLQGCRDCVLVIDHDVEITEREMMCLMAYGVRVRTYVR